MKRRIYSAITVLCMLFALLPTAVMAETQINDITYVITEEGTATIIGCDVTLSGDIVIPGTIDGYTVTGIDEWALSDYPDLTSVVLADNITSIGAYAFYSCTGIKDISLSQSLTYIGEGAFECCESLTDIDIPQNVTTIGGWAFSYCQNLSYINLPSSLTEIEEGAFLECHNLTDVYYSGTEEEWAQISIGLENECLTNATIHYTGEEDENTDFTYDITEDGTAIITGYNATMGSDIVIPETIDGYRITGIGDNAFYRCTFLTSVQLPEGLTSIGIMAFAFCKNLASVDLPDSLTRIGLSAFYGNNSLTSVNIPKGVTTIENSPFVNCESLTEITVAEDNEYYTSVDGNLFSKDQTELVQYAIGNPRAEYIVPEGVTSIGLWAFSLCSGLTGVKLPQGITNINTGTFSNCENLTSVEIPNSVTSIRDYAFSGCDSMTDVYYDGSESDWAKISIDQSNDSLANATIHYMAEPMKVSVPDIKGKAGDTVLVDVIVEDNTGIASLGLEFDYDMNAMTLDDVIVNEEIVATITKPEYSDIMPYHIMFDSPGNFTFNGTLLTLQFTLNEDIASGDYPIGVDFFKGRDGDYIDGVDTNFDENFEPVDITYESGVINVYTPGDINDDTRINNKDATYLLRYLAGWDIEDLAKNALDTDGSGRVNEFDATHLLRYIARWNVELN